jgi:hypothetical protein
MSAPRRARSASTVVKERDQERSTFTDILDRLVLSTPGAIAAALVDFAGETVDYAGELDPFELKVTAAHWQIVMSQVDQEKLGVVRQITVRARGRSYLVRSIHARYWVVLVLHRHAAFAQSDRALQEADAQLCAEAGFPLPGDVSKWFGVEVETEPHDRARPARLRGAQGWKNVEVMGCMVGLKPGERGFRVRLPNGAEMMLVRERPGRWFADERLD